MSVQSQTLRERLVGLAVILIAAGAAATGAAAQDICVTCEQPYAAYACAFDDASPVRITATGAPLVCAKELAQRGGHARCSIRRNASGPCEGERVVIMPPASDPIALTPPPGMTGEPQAQPATLAPPPLPAGNGAARANGGPASGEALPPITAAPPNAAPGEAPEPPPQGPPKTVEELAKRTAKSSKEGLQDAGDAVAGAAKKTGETIGEAGSAIGNAAKSTWRCMSSLFSDC